MKEIFDIKADVKNRGDLRRDVLPITEKTRVDEKGFTHYVFSKVMFENPYYVIPDDDNELFQKFIDGGSREYPSDGNIPCDIVAGEAKYILNKIIDISKDPNHKHHLEARETLKKDPLTIIRGTMKLYMGKYTTRDWRRKRYTDDIDFWVFNVHLLEHVLKRSGWVKNKITREWEKKVQWTNLYENEKRESILIAANDTNQLLDFGAGSYLEGSGLTEIFNKKIKRGHDVDLSDIINVALVNNGVEGKHKDEWIQAWTSFEQAANTRSTRITSNIISLCRHALAIADYIERVGWALYKYQDSIMDKKVHPDPELNRICSASIHWIAYLKSYGADATRMLIHDFLTEQAKFKSQHSRNLRNFAKRLLNLLNSKYDHLKVIFEIEQVEFKIITKSDGVFSTKLKEWLVDKPIDWKEVDYHEPLNNDDPLLKNEKFYAIYSDMSACVESLPIIVKNDDEFYYGEIWDLVNNTLIEEKLNMIFEL